MVRLVMTLVLFIIVPVMSGEESLTLEQELNCDFSKLVSDESYRHVVALILEKQGNRLVLEPIKEKGINRVVLFLKEADAVKAEDEEIEFVILDDSRACLKTGRY